MTTTLADIPAKKSHTQSIREEHRRWRSAAPRIRVWANKPDGSPGLVLRGEVSDSMAGNFRKTKNVAAPGMLRLRTDHYMARWLMSIPNDPTAKKNVVITVDWMGGRWRWSGILKNWRLRTQEGVRYLEVTWIDDLQFMQYMLGPPNPLLPIPIFQFPRVLPVFVCPPPVMGGGQTKTQKSRTCKMGDFDDDPDQPDQAEREPLDSAG